MAETVSCPPKSILPFFPGNMTRLHFLASLPIRCDHVVESDQWHVRITSRYHLQAKAFKKRVWLFGLTLLPARCRCQWGLAGLRGHKMGKIQISKQLWGGEPFCQPENSYRVWARNKPLCWDITYLVLLITTNEPSLPLLRHLEYMHFYRCLLYTQSPNSKSWISNSNRFQVSLIEIFGDRAFGSTHHITYKDKS